MSDVKHTFKLSANVSGAEKFSHVATLACFYSRGRSRNFKRRGAGGRIFFKKRGGGGPTTYSGAICIANKQNHLKKGGGGGPDPLDLPGVALFTFTMVIAAILEFKAP